LGSPSLATGFLLAATAAMLLLFLVHCHCRPIVPNPFAVIYKPTYNKEENGSSTNYK